MTLIRIAEIATLVLLLPMLVLGSLSGLTSPFLLALYGTALAVAILWLPQLLAYRQSWFSILLGVLYVLAVVWGLLQAAPLPAGWVENLPQRSFQRDALAAVGLSDVALPLSLSDQALLPMLAHTVVGVAMFLFGSQQQARHRMLTVTVLLVVIFANLFFAIFQRSAGVEGGFDLYRLQGVVAHAGAFINRNNHALSLAMAIPLVFACARQYLPGAGQAAMVARLVSFALVGLLFVGIIISTSRSGLALGCMALLASAPMMFGPSGSGRASPLVRQLALAAPVLLLGAALFLIYGADTLLRVTALEGHSFSRNIIWDNTWQLLVAHMPFGSGFGSFVPLYHMVEKPEHMIPGVFINHAHNDYLELMLEGGLPLAVVLAAFVGLFLWQLKRIFETSNAPPEFAFVKAASISASLPLLHSLVEFPLRNAALLALFGYCLGLMAAKLPQHQRQRPPRQA